MKCIDFDKEFRYYLHQWMQKNNKKYKNMDAMEAAMPDVYRTFLDTPADFLAGKKPGEYFDTFTDPKQLVNWMEDYIKQRVPVPDMLLNRISALGLESEGPLVNLLQKERATSEIKMCAITLLREIDSAAPLDLYVSMQLNRGFEDQDELADNALESLGSLGERAKDAVRTAFDKANDAGKECLLSLLCDDTPDESLIQQSIALLQAHPERAAILSDYVSRLGDERAIPFLQHLAADEDTGYLDYIELRSAIEKLGGDAPEREFTENDPAYEALRSLDQLNRKPE